MFEEVKKYTKAIVGFLAPGIVALGVAVQDSSPGGQVVTEAEWIGIAIACIGTGTGVYFARNRPAYQEPEDVSDSDEDLEINQDDAPAGPQHAVAGQ